MDAPHSDGWTAFVDACQLAGGYWPKRNIRTFPGVFVYFARRLLLATRVIKEDATGFNAFSSPKQPAVGGVSSTYDLDWLLISKLAKRYTSGKIFV